jgi:adenylate cyclase
MKSTGFLRLHALRIGVGFAIVVLMLLNALGAIPLGFAQRLETYAYDQRLQWTMPGTVDPRIVIVDVDERSLLQQGHWPWPRHEIAQMIDILFDKYQIDVLGFDVLFAEPDRSSGLSQLEEMERTDLKDNPAFRQALDRLRPSLRYDHILADSLKNRRIALGYYFRHDGQTGSRVGSLPAPALAAGSFDAEQVWAYQASGYAANLEVLQQAAASGGFFNTSPLVDADGVQRRISLLQKLDGQVYETLSLAVTRLAMPSSELALNYADGENNALALEALQLGNRRIAVDDEVAALVPYRGKQGSFPYVSAIDVLHGKVAPDVLLGAIVLVGTTAPGLLDLRSTPMQESYAGVELHANMIAGMLDGNIKERPAYVMGLNLVFILLMGGFLALALPALSPLAATVLTATTTLAMLAGNLYFWQVQNMILPLASGLILISALFIFNMSYGYFVDARGKRMLANLFGQYVPPELVDEMAKDPGSYSLEGSNRDMTVLFSDVRGFTTISEGLDPKQLTQLMNEFLTPMTHVIHHHRGTIDKYMGDAIMAFWGAPVPDPDHARNALLAAMEMVTKLDAMQEHFKSRGWPPIKVGVGLNTGDMTVGNMGSEFRLAYTIMGDAVNLGSRLESLTKNYGVDIMVSEFTSARVPDFAFRELDCVRVKGKDKPVKIYEPMGPERDLEPAEREELALYNEALRLYRSQQWGPAREAFSRLEQLAPMRKLYAIYLERIDHFGQQPPPADWDGTYTFLTK